MRRITSIMATFLPIATLAALPANAALEGRLETFDGSGVFLAYYDTDQDITWATDATVAPLLNWADANAWAAGLTIGGVTGWRLLSVDKDDDDVTVDMVSCAADQTACLDNEFAYHFTYNVINGTNPGPFDYLTAIDYWTSTFSGSGLAFECNFNGNFGVDNAAVQTNASWPVKSGDVPLVAVSPSVPSLSPIGLTALAVILVTCVASRSRARAR